MSVYVLDTDILSLWLRGHSSVCQQVAAHNLTELYTTIVTIEEMLRGWYTQIRRAKNDEQMARAYASLQQTVEIASRLQILAFDHVSIQRFHELRKQKVRIGTSDLKIAATALERQAILVTRNRSDFGQIPGLLIENWS